MRFTVHNSQVDVDYTFWNDATYRFKVYVDGRLVDTSERLQLKSKWWIVGRAQVAGRGVDVTARKKGWLSSKIEIRVA